VCHGSTGAGRARGARVDAVDAARTGFGTRFIARSGHKQNVLRNGAQDAVQNLV
jgi:hypothetical protein